MRDSDDATPLTLDDEEIVTRRKAIGLAALVLGAGTLVSSQAFADDSEESDASGDSSSDATGDSSGDTSSDTASDDSSEEESDGDGA